MSTQPLAVSHMDTEFSGKIVALKFTDSVFCFNEKGSQKCVRSEFCIVLRVRIGQEAMDVKIRRGEAYMK